MSQGAVKEMQPGPQPDKVVGGLGGMHKVHIRTGGSLGSIAELIFGEDSPENRHHLWDWNRDILPSPEALVPSGTDLTVADQGFQSGGPGVAELMRSDLSSAALKASSGLAGSGSEPNASSIGLKIARQGDASPPEGEDLSGMGSEASGSRLSESRRTRNEIRRGDLADTTASTVDEGSDGAESQRRQDEMKPGGAAEAEGERGGMAGASDKPDLTGGAGAQETPAAKRAREAAEKKAADEKAKTSPPAADADFHA